MNPFWKNLRADSYALSSVLAIFYVYPITTEMDEEVGSSSNIHRTVGIEQRALSFIIPVAFCKEQGVSKGFSMYYLLKVLALLIINNS